MGRRKVASSEKEEESLFLEICEKIANSKQGIEHILKADDRFPSVSVFFKWKKASEARNNIYLQAKEVQGHIFADEVNRIAQELESMSSFADGELISAHTRRLVALQNSRTWLAKNFAPRQFGDKDTAELERIKEMLEKQIHGNLNGYIS